MTDLASASPPSAFRSAFLGRGRGWAPGVGIYAFAAMVLLGIWAAAAWLAASGRENVIKDARAELLGAQRILASQVGRTFENTQGILRSINIWLSAQIPFEPRQGLVGLAGYLDRLQDGNEFQVNILLFDAAGDIVAYGPHGPAKLNVADREYIRALDGKPVGTVHIGNQIVTRNAGSKAIPVVMKARPNPYGIAYIVTSLPVEPIARAFEGLLISARGTTGFLRTDGTTLLRFPDPLGVVGTKIDLARMSKYLGINSPIGFVERRPNQLGEEVMTAFALLPSQPLIVFASFRIADLDRKIDSILVVVIGLAAVATVLTLAFAAWLSFVVRQRERAAERAVEALAAAEEANSAKTQFLANISHELRTPLNAINGFAEMLSAQIFGPLEERYRGYAGDILASGNHLLSIVNQLLDMASIEARREQLDSRPLLLETVVDDVSRMLRPMALERKVCLSVLVPNEVRQIDGDARAIRQILINLVGNAIRFTKPGGAVALIWSYTADGVDIVVADQGTGIAPEDLPRIFDLFWQREDVYTRSQGGIGLGLPLTKKLVDALDGSIAVDSRVGIGTTFTVSLPGASVSAALPLAA